MTTDFHNIHQRQPEFGSALKTKLAKLAQVPENALRLNGLREGSIVAELLVVPITKPHYVNPKLVIERLHEAIAHDDTGKNVRELCALTGGPLESCFIEFKDLGLAVGTLAPFKPEPEQRAQQSETPASSDFDQNTVIIVVGAAAGMLLLCAIYKVLRYLRVLCAIYKAQKNSSDDIYSKVDVMEEGKKMVDTVAEKPIGISADEIDETTSTNCPSELPSELPSEKQSEPADDVELPRPPSICRPRSAESQRGSTSVTSLPTWLPERPPTSLPQSRPQTQQQPRNAFQLGMM
jgi:hypothetical protein